jgi:hypothetical protein
MSLVELTAERQNWLSTLKVGDECSILSFTGRAPALCRVVRVDDQHLVVREGQQSGDVVFLRANGMEATNLGQTFGWHVVPADDDLKAFWKARADQKYWSEQLRELPLRDVSAALLRKMVKVAKRNLKKGKGVTWSTW